MAEPVRNDEPLSSMRSPETTARPGPVPVTGGAREATRLLPERAMDKPLGEWPLEPMQELHGSRFGKERSATGALDTLREKARPVTEFVQDRVADMRQRFRAIRGRVRSGELQSEMRTHASELTDEASRQARMARTRAEFYARSYPLQFIAGAAAAGFAIGFLLRLWRDE